jgi:hypothetical protein
MNDPGNLQILSIGVRAIHEAQSSDNADMARNRRCGRSGYSPVPRHAPTAPAQD